MRIFFNDGRHILGAFPDNTTVQYSGAHVMYCPFDIKDKLSKPYSFTRQKHDVGGHALFVGADGAETTSALSKVDSRFVENMPAVETISLMRQVGIWDSPGEWSLDDVYAIKYSHLASGKVYWFDEFTTFSAVDFSRSRLGTGINSITINSGDSVVFKPLHMRKKVSSLSIYVEAGDDFVSKLDVKYSVDGGVNFNAAPVAVKKPFQDIIIKLNNPLPSSQAVRALAIFY